MISFRDFLREAAYISRPNLNKSRTTLPHGSHDSGVASEYSNPDAPQHDLWKHGVPAAKHRHDGHLVIGKRGERHEDLTDNHAEYHHGILHKKTKQFYRTGKDTHMDSTDLMTARQRMNHDY